MRLKQICLTVILISSPAAAFADEKCAQKPDVVQTYLRDHQGTSLVTFDDLVDTDSQEAWHKNSNKGLCPGFAISDMDGSGRKWYGLALLYKKDGKPFEKLVLLSPGTGGLKEQTIIDHAVMGEPEVVWHGKPGKYFDYNINGIFRIQHDTIMYEEIGKTASAYYLVKGKLRSALTSD